MAFSIVFEAWRSSVRLKLDYHSYIFQDPENKQWFTPDKTMEPVFGKEKIKAFGMAKYLKDHLS
jgi:SWIB/MDM2 domain